MPPAIIALIFLAVGLILLLIEIKFVPGMGLIGVLAVGIIAYGAYLAMAHYEPITASAIIGGAGLATAALIILAVRSKTAGKLVLGSAQQGQPSDLPDQSAELVGKSGVTVTDLRPVGVARIDGRRMDVVADDGAYIHADEAITVVRIRQNSIIVTRR